MTVSGENVIAMILGGGQGKRLYPLTKVRSKPAVPVGGKFRLIDIPISNCLHAGISKVFILTQFNSVSLHRHVEQTYKFDYFHSGFIQILAAQQTFESADWYQGTADAVRQNLKYVPARNDLVLILSGDHLYRMNFLAMMESHEGSGADITIAALPIPRAKAQEFGILRTDGEGRISAFIEKPSDEETLDDLRIPEGAFGGEGVTSNGTHLASMGIYLFRKKALTEALESFDGDDFGGDIIPASIDRFKVHAYLFDGYWEDIGTIRSFYDANLKLLSELPEFNFYDEHRPIYTKPRYLPGSKISNCSVESSILSDGSVIEKGVSIERSVIGIRSIVREGTVIRNSIIMGADYYDDEPRDGVMIGIGKGCVIDGVIIDKNARIGDGAKLGPALGQEDVEKDSVVISDGILILSKNTVIQPGTVI